ncbi:MAG: chromosome segregation protein SMC [Planctomycetes bacterium]|nr:chromosome segregation protein SMC [Planctomycetota bacterium]
MRLKRIQLFGFKSFADRTSIDFGANTLTGVVGPNGCGKSNVVDSVRWVLGEQRPTSMRGSEMTDVIFKGSASRPALGVAEVTLILDNESNVLAGRGSEVAITRRVFKSGEGEYMIDGDKVRLKDVREMLFDTGLGSRGYSVLEQGKIDAVLSANPLERRRIFEEAAGISRYRQRKVEAELRLKRVADDMTRLDDLLGELGTRVRSLKIQAGKAERFVAARDEWALQRARFFKHRLYAWQAELETLATQAGELEEKAGLLRKTREEAETDAEVRERERQALTAELERLSTEVARLSGDGRAVDERKAQLSARLVSWRESATDERARHGALEKALKERESELERITSELSGLDGVTRAKQAAASAESQALAQLEARLREVRSLVERKNQATLSLLSVRTQAENKIAALEAAHGPAQQREAQLVERVSSQKGGVDALKSEETELEQRAREAVEAQARHEHGRREMAQAMADLARAAADAEAEKKTLELDRARVTSKIDVLLDRERDLEELTAGAKRVLEGVKKNDEPVSSTRLMGLVADHLRTDTKHARALDAVLGHRANALVAKDRETAELVLGWLKKREAGQVGLVLPAGVGPARPRATALVDERIVGKLIERVRCAPEFAQLSEILCGDVLIARDLESALTLSAEHAGWRFVTLEGEFVDAAGLAGGHRALTQGAVGRRASAEEMRVDVDDLTQRITALEAERAGMAEKRMALQKEWERSTAELETRRAARNTAESQLATVRARLRDQESSLRALEQESGSAVTEIARLARELTEAAAHRERATTDYERERRALTELEQERAELEETREQRVKAENAAQLEATRARTELEGLTRRVADLTRTRDENRLERARAERLAQEHEESARAATAEIESLAEASARILVERAALDEKLAEVRRVTEAGRGSIDQSRRRVEAVTRELEETATALSSLRLDEQRRALARDEILRRAQEELQLDVVAEMADFVPEEALAETSALDELEATVRELKARLEKIGPVNMEAVTELEESGSRLDFLTAQRDDLNRARATLEETIKTIDGESKRLFLETFETVRGNFQRIFRQLFGGGKADVTLEPDVDPLDAGVDIVARPPGRELLSIGLLSGGQRTLTALALLFAVFEARPSPFCILDEVDAALDDANIERFLAMLDGFRKHTQFVVVTHNKGTMAACDSLYGVTMETKGVSRQVSVELADAERWTESAPPTNERASGKARPLDAESGLPVHDLSPAPARGGVAVEAESPDEVESPVESR